MSNKTKPWPPSSKKIDSTVGCGIHTLPSNLSELSCKKLGYAVLKCHFTSILQSIYRNGRVSCKDEYENLLSCAQIKLSNPEKGAVLLKEKRTEQIEKNENKFLGTKEIWELRKEPPKEFLEFNKDK